MGKKSSKISLNERLKARRLSKGEKVKKWKGEKVKGWKGEKMANAIKAFDLTP